MGYRKFIIKLCVPLAAVLLTLLLLEAGIRGYRAATNYFVPPAQHETPPVPLHITTAEPHLYRLNPQHPDISEQGTRDDAVPAQKPPGTFRILVLGDSLAYGAAVPRARTFPNQLEALLRERRAGAEVINAGVSGYTAYNELHYYLAEGRRYGADIVIVAFCLNDAVNPRLHWGDTPGTRIPAEAIPNHEYDRTHILPKIEQMNQTHGRPAGGEGGRSAWLRRSELYRAVEPAIRRLFRRGDEELTHDSEGRPTYLTAEDEISIETLLSDGPEWRWLTGIYDQLHAAVRADNARLIIALFPLAYQLDEGYPYFPQQRLAAYCEQSGILCLDLLPALAQRGQRSVFLLNNSGYYDVWHLSEEGHRLAGAELLRFLGEQGLLTPGARRRSSRAESAQERAIRDRQARAELILSASSEDRVDERRERRSLREDQQRAHQKEHDDDRQQPKLFVLAQEEPNLTGQR